MKEFIINILPKLKSLSKRLDNQTILKKQHWVMLDESGVTNTTYIFRDNDELLISINGDVTIGTWEYLSSNKLLIKFSNKMYLYNNEYFDDQLLALRKDGAELYSLFVNEGLLLGDGDVFKKIEGYFDNKLLEQNHKKESKVIQVPTPATEELSWFSMVGVFLAIAAILTVFIMSIHKCAP